MAFISGYENKYFCKNCGYEVSQQFIKTKKGGVKVIYKHARDICIFVNGIPVACENNGKILNNEVVEVMPNYRIFKKARILLNIRMTYENRDITKRINRGKRSKGFVDG